MPRLKSVVACLIIALVQLIMIAVQASLTAGEIDLSHAVVVVPDGLSSVESKAVRVLVEEVHRRAHRLGYQDPLADGEGASHCGRSSSLV